MEANATHTPGPWQVADWGPDYPPVIAVGDDRIARMDSNVPRPVVEANARLIATAPRMLEALKAQDDAERFPRETHDSLYFKASEMRRTILREIEGAPAPDVQGGE